MTLRKNLYAIAAAIVLSWPGADAQTLELPTRTIGGRECYIYQVDSKENISSLCRKLGLSKSEVIRYNPSVADGLRRGQTLYFPVEALKNAAKSSEAPASDEKHRHDTTLADSTPSPKATVQPSTSETPTAASGGGVHLVKKNETIYGISRQYGLSQEALIAANPQIERGIKAGMILEIPRAGAEEPEVTETNAATSTPAAEPISPAPDVAANDDTPSDSLPTADPFERQSIDSTEPVSDELKAADDTIRISVMLPFMLQDEHPSKQAQLYTEFFKGMLMAVDSLRTYGHPLRIDAHDTADRLSTVDSLLHLPQIEMADMIIAPDDDDQLSAISDFGKRNAISVINIFAVKSTAYRDNTYMLQANIPHSDMYRQAVDELLRSFPGYTPVLLTRTDGKTDKAEFLTTLRATAAARGVQTIDIEFTGTLHDDKLASLDRSGKYIFIPASGAQSEFNRIIPAVRAYKESLPDYSLVELFGYPEWITFKGSILENLHFMNATIYTRFFNDAESQRSRQFADGFSRWYDTPLMNAIPVQGILGFDTGMYLIQALNRNADSDDDFSFDYKGIQNDYRFATPADARGKVNGALYFINYRPSGIVDKRSL